MFCVITLDKLFTLCFCVTKQCNLVWPKAADAGVHTERYKDIFFHSCGTHVHNTLASVSVDINCTVYVLDYGLLF